MDVVAIEFLAAAGVQVSRTHSFPEIRIRMSEDGRAIPVAHIVHFSEGNDAAVPLKSISDLWTGDAKPPDFSRGPPPAYKLFFFAIERTAANYCTIANQVPNDDEFRRLYTLLRRRPDGEDANPLFSYLQAAVRLYASLRDVSQAEHEAVARRLEQSAKRFDAGRGSTNYFQRVLTPFLS